MYCITNLLDRFELASHKSDEVELVHDLMVAMRSSGLWPIWPVGGRSKPLQEQLDAFSSLEIPIISASHRHKHKGRKCYTTALTSRTVISLSDKLRDLCDGLCLDCLKGRDRCGQSLQTHPDPWPTYKAEQKKVFKQRKRFRSTSRGSTSSSTTRARSPEIIFADFEENERDWGMWVDVQ